MNVIENKCPVCGALLKVVSDGNLVTCEYCRHKFIYEAPNRNNPFHKEGVLKDVTENYKGVEDSQYDVRQKRTLLLICIFLGIFGVHYFYTRQFLKGLLYLCTFGLCFIDWIVDIIRIANGTFADKNGVSVS